MNTKFYKEFQDKYPTILGSDRNISYTQFLEEMVTELQQQVKLFAIPVVSNNEVAVCDNCGCHPTVLYTSEFGRYCVRCNPKAN